MVKGSPIDRPTKEALINAYKEFRSKKHPRPMETAAQVLRVGIASAYRIFREYKENGFKFIDEPKPKPRYSVPREKPIEDWHAAIHGVISDFHEANYMPTHKDVYEKLKKMGFPYKRTRLQKELKRLKYAQRRPNPSITMKNVPRIRAWRRAFLLKLAYLKKTYPDRPIVSLDETWLNANHRKSKILSRLKDNGELRDGPRIQKSGLGARLIIFHAGTKDGFIVGAADVFKAKKRGKSDYHTDGSMTQERFLKTWENLLDHLPPNSIILIDNATYHSERVPGTGPCPSKARKAEIQEWLRARNIPFDAKDKVVFLRELTRTVGAQYSKPTFVIDKMAEERGHTVLRLPPGHCELQPIEPIWRAVKSYVARNNTEQTLSEVERLVHEAFEKAAPPEMWQRCFAYAEENAERYAKEMGISQREIEQEGERIIITLNDDDSDDDFFESDAEMDEA